MCFKQKSWSILNLVNWEKTAKVTAGRRPRAQACCLCCGFIGTWPHVFLHVLFMAAYTQGWQDWAAVAETNRPEFKIFTTYHFMEKICLSWNKPQKHPSKIIIVFENWCKEKSNQWIRQTIPRRVSFGLISQEKRFWREAEVCKGRLCLTCEELGENTPGKYNNMQERLSDLGV